MGDTRGGIRCAHAMRQEEFEAELDGRAFGYYNDHLGRAPEPRQPVKLSWYHSLTTENPTSFPAQEVAVGAHDLRDSIKFTKHIVAGWLNIPPEYLNLTFNLQSLEDDRSLGIGSAGVPAKGE